MPANQAVSSPTSFSFLKWVIRRVAFMAKRNSPGTRSAQPRTTSGLGTR